jgi:hypothetical protein
VPAELRVENLAMLVTLYDERRFSSDAGASGARVLVTLIYELIRRDVRRGTAALCLGGGTLWLWRWGGRVVETGPPKRAWTGHPLEFARVGWATRRHVNFLQRNYKRLFSFFMFQKKARLEPGALE